MLLLMTIEAIDDIDQKVLFRKIYDKYAAALYAYAEIQLKSCPDLTEDAVQETWLGVLPYLKQISTMSNAGARAYLFTALEHVAHRMLQKERAVQSNVISLEVLSENDAPDPSNLLDNICTSEAVQHIADTILSLPENYQQIIYLHYLSNMSLREIANLLHLPYQTIRTRFRSGKARLIEKLLEKGVPRNENK